MSTKRLAIIAVALLLCAMLSTVFWQKISFSYQKSKLDRIVDLVAKDDLQAARYSFAADKLLKNELGRIRVLSRNPDAIQIDTGGGHSVSGYLYCETSPQDFNMYFGESIKFHPLESRWWGFKSSEE